MHPGDLILTPSWTYHDHGNLTHDPVVWMERLDIPVVQYARCQLCGTLRVEARSPV